MAQLSKESIEFMADLWKNNSKLWFDANRGRYDEYVRLPLKALAESLAVPVTSILPEFSGKAKVSRINNDIRFAPNKPLYKEHMWVSFGGMMPEEADFFVGISGSGWSAGAGIGAPKREPLEIWRVNLIRFFPRWQRYRTALEESCGLRIYAENPYAKPLFPTAPQPLQQLLQARSTWLITGPHQEFGADPHRMAFLDLCRILPAYFFMVIPPDQLEQRLMELGTTIKPPDGEIEKLWEMAAKS